AERQHRRLVGGVFGAVVRGRRSRLSGHRGHRGRQPDRHLRAADPRLGPGDPRRVQRPVLAGRGPGHRRQVTGDDLALILDAAGEAGELILRRREAGVADVTYKADGSPVTSVDLEADDLIKARLLAARPDYGWLSEESADDPARLAKRRIFLVDPIDGTRAYVRGRPWFAVSIAVVEDGAPTCGVVLAPELGETYWAVAGGGAFLNGERIAPG